jgi:O-antigen/teichoic acid export membrane protein
LYNYLKKISKKQWFKVSSLSTVAIGVKFFTSLINSKIMAYFLGPSGIAYIENIRNIFTSVDAIGILGTSTGTTNDILQNRNKLPQLYPVFSTSIWFVFCWSLFICSVVAFCLPYFSEFNNFNIVNYYFLVILFALYPLVVLHLLFQSFLNGFEAYSNIIKSNISVGIFSLILNLILIYYLGVRGVLITIIFLPIVLLLYYIYYLKNKLDFKEILKLKYVQPSLLKRYNKFSAILVLSGIFSPLVYLAIRGQIIQQLGWFEAGIWSALTRVSTFYLIIPTTLISYYFLPKILKTTTVNRAFVYARKYLILIIPFFIVLFLILYNTSNFWIKIILTDDFLSMKAYLKFQFLGDFFKVIALIFANYFLAKKKVLIFTVCEIISLASFYFFSNYFIKDHALKGVVMAYLLSITLYLLALSLFFIRQFKKSKSTF